MSLLKKKWAQNSVTIGNTILQISQSTVVQNRFPKQHVRYVVHDPLFILPLLG